MDFNNSGSSIVSTTWETMAYELTNNLADLELIQDINNVSIDPDLDNQTCDISLELPIIWTIGANCSFSCDNYVNDASFSQGTSDLNSTDLVNAICEAWKVIAKSIDLGQQLSAYDCQIDINVQWLEKTLNIEVSDFPCLVTKQNNTTVITPKDFLGGSPVFIH